MSFRLAHDTKLSELMESVPVVVIVPPASGEVVAILVTVPVPLDGIDLR